MADWEIMTLFPQVKENFLNTKISNKDRLPSFDGSLILTCKKTTGP